MTEEKTHKPRDPYNPDNLRWLAKPRQNTTLKAIETMKYMGCRSRTVYLEMAMELMAKTHGKPQPSL